MKSLLITLMILIVVACASVSAAFADESITKGDIDEGMKFCAEYPVKLTLNGKDFIFNAADMSPVIVKGRTLIPARALFESVGGTVDWNEDRQEVDIRLGNSSVVLTIGSNVAWVNEGEEDLDVPAMILAKDGEYYGSTMIPVRFVAESVGFSVDWDDNDRAVVISSHGSGVKKDDPAEEALPADSSEIATGPAISFWDAYDYAPLDMMNAKAAKKLIFIDPGHGGKDTGAIGHENKSDQLYEKTVNLKVALYLRDFLTQAGANIYLLREDDTYFSLLERPELANSLKAQLYVAIHNNASDYDWPTGTETHYNSKVDDEGRDEMQLYGIYSKDVAQSVQTEMLKELGTFDRGIKSSPKLAVLNKSNMPAIVIEGAFISNENDFQMMKTDEYAKRYAYAVAKGLIEVMNKAYQ